MTQSPPFTLEEVSDAFDEFEISELLGCGTFKAAYRAESAGNPLVVTILLEPLTDDLEDVDSSALPTRFAREMHGMLAVDSEHVVKLLQQPSIRIVAGKSHVWYTEPLYSGGTLQDRLAAGEHGWAFAKEVTLALLRAVEAMWGAGQIVHRDIKPGNVVFSATDIPVLLDLGIAYFPDLTDLTDAHAASPRTGRYAAPEQFEMRRSATIDFRTDLFLIGIVAFECLTGNHPFWTPGVGDDYFSRLNSFGNKETANLDCPDGFKEILTRLLAARPNRRYRTVRLALEALEGLE